ncbi:MAG: glutaredoxin family protein [Verrucomicrobia bacterium]|nr:glutaredoxin family protein [Verrucomicrobiota bacterium]
MSATSMVLYVKTGCPWCNMAENYLDKDGYKYQRVDVRRDPGSLEVLKRVSGQTYVPTLVAGDLVLSDFGLDELEEFLNEHNIEP